MWRDNTPLNIMNLLMTLNYAMPYVFSVSMPEHIKHTNDVSGHDLDGRVKFVIAYFFRLI
jgi:hypothetical protein